MVAINTGEESLGVAKGLNLADSGCEQESADKKEPLVMIDGN